MTPCMFKEAWRDDAWKNPDPNDWVAVGINEADSPTEWVNLGIRRIGELYNLAPRELDPFEKFDWIQRELRHLN